MMSELDMKHLGIAPLICWYNSLVEWALISSEAAKVFDGVSSHQKWKSVFYDFTLHTEIWSC